MATINGFTAAHMQAIEDNTIVGAHITGNDLILDQFDGGMINVGSIVGIGVNGTADWPLTNIGQTATGPESVVTANPGSIRMKTNGEVWVKVTGIGNTGWAKLTSLSSAQTVLVICTSSTRPSSPTVGQRIYETDTGKNLMYYGATTGWKKTWSDPWGVIDVKSNGTTGQTGISSATDVTSLTATFTNPTANRRIKLSAAFRVTQNTADAVVEGLITNGSNVVQNKVSVSLSAGFAGYLTPLAIVTPAAGSVTYKVRLSTTGGTVDTNVAATQPALFVLEDIGPSVASPPSS